MQTIGHLVSMHAQIPWMNLISPMTIKETYNVIRTGNHDILSLRDLKGSNQLLPINAFCNPEYLGV